MKNKGICYLVGAGPGDLGLVTLRAKECVEDADVVIYDALSSAEILRWMKPGAEKVFVGKRAKDHALSQEGINDLIVEKTMEGMMARLSSLPAAVNAATTLVPNPLTIPMRAIMPRATKVCCNPVGSPIRRLCLKISKSKIRINRLASLVEPSWLFF